MRCGSFKLKEHNFIDSLIAKERVEYKQRCQQVAVLLISPDGKRLCLTLPDKALKDQRLNLSPPQGKVERNESLQSAAIREVREEVSADIVTPVAYLGSIMRQIDESHPKGHKFDQLHYHWVVGFAASYSLEAQPPLVEARWQYLDSMRNNMRLMSPEKWEMFSLALQKLQTLSRDPALVRRKSLFPSQQEFAVA